MKINFSKPQIERFAWVNLKFTNKKLLETRTRAFNKLIKEKFNEFLIDAYEFKVLRNIKTALFKINIKVKWDSSSINKVVLFALKTFGIIDIEIKKVLVEQTNVYLNDLNNRDK